MVATVAQFGCGTMGPKSLFASKDKAADSTKKSSLASKLPWAKKDDKPEPYPNPVKMAVTWTPDTLVQTGRTPTRGFGGRIFFYDDKAHAVPVEGTLVVHGFDETATQEKDRVKRFEFTPEQFTQHYSQSDLGASYSVWVPWDAVGGEQERISLVTSFQSKTEDTAPIQGSPSIVVLPGVKTAEQIAEYKTPLSPQFAKWKQASSASQPPRTGLTTTTIPRSHSTPASSRTQGAAIDTKVANSLKTPSLDIPMAPRREPSSTVLPTSAIEPIQQP
jgi:hypothetical protein